MLEVRLIGKFEIRYGGEPVVISSRAAQSLFAYLVLNAGTSLRREKLAGMFWPDTTEEKARTYLRQALWQIRKAFPSKANPDYLIADDINIAFNSAAEYGLDVTSLVKVEESASIEEWMDALSVYQGELLPGFYDEWIAQEREYLHAVYERKITRLLDLLENERRWHEVLEWAERWISFGHAPEVAYRALVVAYDALGDRAKVASTYERCVQALHALGLEPSEQTRALAFKRTSTLNIPIPLTSFIGRATEIKEVAGLLSKSRLVTLTGSGGVGKTRLAIQVIAEVLDRFPDGVWFFDLAPLSEPELVPNTLASLVGLQESADPNVSFTDMLVNYLRSRCALVLFDNCEHLIEACAQLVYALLSSCERLSILATSRESLRVAGEIPYRIPSLGLPDQEVEANVEVLKRIESVRLFVERATVISPGFALHTQNALAIAKICQRLDGIPLAIELAAARANLLSVEQILKRLDDRFKLLRGGIRTALPRQQTLWATIEWSYSLLSDTERILFRRLAVFRGSWTLEAAEAVCRGEGLLRDEALDLLSQLMDKSLVVVDPGGAETRYRSLETIHEFAREKLTEATEAGRLQDRHLAYYLKTAEQIESELLGARQLELLDYLDKELDNIRLALEWSLSSGRGEEALRLFGALGWFWIIRCHFREASDWFRRALMLREGASKNAKAKAMFHAGTLYFLKDDLSASRSILMESLDLYRDLGALKEISDVLLCLGIGEINDRNIDRACELLEETLRIGREVNHKPAIARALFNLGNISWMRGDHLGASQQFDESLAICRQTQDNHLISMALIYVAEFAFAQKNNLTARQYYGEALSASLKLKNRRVTMLSLLGFADILSAEGFHTQSAQLQGFSVTLLTDLGAKFSEMDLVFFNRTADLLKTSLGESSYQKEFDTGKTLRLEQAIEIALEHNA